MTQVPKLFSSSGDVFSFFNRGLNGDRHSLFKPRRRISDKSERPFFKFGKGRKSGLRGDEEPHDTQDDVSGEKKPLRLLIITGSTGGGHLSASRALAQEARGREIECTVVDAVNVSGGVRLATKGLYEFLVKNWPWAYGRFYGLIDQHKSVLRVYTFLLDQTFRKLDRLIRLHKPDCIVCTHDIVLPRLARLRRLGHKFRLAVIVTDIYPHAVWLNGSIAAQADLVFVPSTSSKTSFEDRARSIADRVFVSGIPIDNSFSEPLANVITMGDQDDPIVLVTSGMIGAGPYSDVLEALSTVKQKCRVVVVCGRNIRAYRSLLKTITRLRTECEHDFSLLRTVSQTDMAALMRSCSVLIGKPGGITLSEALAAGCPFVVYDPLVIPGQEPKNTDYLIEQGAGVCVYNTAQLRHIVNRLLSEPEYHRGVRDNAVAASRPFAARDVTDKLIEAWDRASAKSTTTVN